MNDGVYRYTCICVTTTIPSWLHLFSRAQPHHPLHDGLPVIRIWCRYLPPVSHTVSQSALIFPAAFPSFGQLASFLLSREEVPKLPVLLDKLRGSKAPENKQKEKAMMV